MTQTSEARDIKPVALEEEMKRSYLDYAMSVIVSRALPDARDGLKPVHRRILYGMKEAGNDYNRPYRKSARVVGDVMGKYHPHGDSAIYDAMVRMAQPFSMGVMLIDGQGNFGSLDGDPPAAMRYTEARLTKEAHALIEDIDKETVDFQPNYDESTVEPVVLPARFPNLLVNGGSGIAVGMATNIPTHNLGEVIDASIALVDNPDLSIDDLIRYVPGPDFPTGGLILGRAGCTEAFRTGRGSIIMRGKTTIEEIRDNRQAIIIHEIPYQVNKARLVERIAELVKEKVVEGISDLRDESDRDGMRIVIELKREAIADVVLNLLFKHTPLQSNFSSNMLALNHGRPEVMNLKQMLIAFLEFREEVIYKRTRFELNQAREKAHLFLGLALAVSNIDAIIELIRKAPDRQAAREQLMDRDWPAQEVRGFVKLIDYKDLDEGHPTYRLSEAQAQGILDLRLHRLTNLERDKIGSDLLALKEEIERLLTILGSRQELLSVLKNELIEIRTSFAAPRRSEIVDFDGDLDYEDLIQREDMVVTVSIAGYIKRVPLSTYRAQRRGGKGRSGMSTKDEDHVSDVFVANTHSPVLFFSTNGKVYTLKVYKLPLGNPQAKGRPMVNLLPLQQGETISTVLVLPEVEDFENTYMMFATSKGGVRRNKIADFQRINASGKIAIKLDEDESLVSVNVCFSDQEIMLFTRQGKAIRFKVDEIRVFAGRDSNGVRGIKLAKDDYVIGMTVVNSQEDVSIEERYAYLKHAASLRLIEGEEASQDISDDEDSVDATQIALSAERIQDLTAREQFVLTITENGFGKRSSAYEYRTIHRGGSGIRNISVTSKNGPVVASFPISNTDDIMLVTDQGQIIRCPVHDIRITGRNAQGVIVFRISDNEKVVAVSKIPASESDEDHEDENDSGEISEE